MKTRYSLRRNALLSPSGVTAGAVVFVFVLALFAIRLLLPDFFLKIATPLFRAGDSITEKADSLMSGFVDAKKLRAENEHLMLQNAERSTENRTLSERVSDLEALIGKGAESPSGIAAGVLARPPQAPYDTLVVNAGEDAGVTLGMEAFGRGGTPLGLVTSLTSSFARITLFSSSGTRTPGWVGKNRTALSILGAGGGTFTAQVSKSAAIGVGDGVYAPGPGALFFGTVTHVETDPASPSATLLITPVQNPFSITWVVLKDTGLTLPVPPLEAAVPFD